MREEKKVNYQFCSVIVGLEKRLDVYWALVGKYKFVFFGAGGGGFTSVLTVQGWQAFNLIRQTKSSISSFTLKQAVNLRFNIVESA